MISYVNGSQSWLYKRVRCGFGQQHVAQALEGVIDMMNKKEKQMGPPHLQVLHTGAAVRKDE